VELDEAFEADVIAVVSAANWTESLDSLGWPTMSVVNLFGTAPGVDSPDMWDSGVMGSEGELDFGDST